MTSSSCTNFDLLDFAYRLDVEPELWQRGVAERVWREFPDLPGILSYEFDYSAAQRPPVVGVATETGSISRFGAGVTEVHEQAVGRDYWPIVRIGAHCASIRERMEANGIPWADPYPVYRVSRAVGYEDIFGLCCVLPGMRGVAFAGPQRETTGTTKTLRKRWTHLAHHLTAAYAARETLRTGSFRRAEAVIDTNGSVQHLSNEPQLPLHVRDGLSRALTQTTAALFRSSTASELGRRRLLDEILREGWTFVHHVDTDGKRYLLAVRNRADRPSGSSLTQRERDVAGLTAAGHSAKEIAYELGISVSAVRSHRAAAVKKLGLSSTGELLRLGACFGKA